jgi:hypothetical protein
MKCRLDKEKLLNDIKFAIVMMSVALAICIVGFILSLVIGYITVQFFGFTPTIKASDSIQYYYTVGIQVFVITLTVLVFVAGGVMLFSNYYSICEKEEK